jgi:hypothetical protein
VSGPDAAVSRTDPAINGLSPAGGRHVAADLLKVHSEPFEIVIRGQCMEPVLLHGDRVRVAPAARLRAGDIVVFQSGAGLLTAHRLLGRTITTRGTRWMTKPDNSDAIDGLMRRDQILGRVTRNLTQRSEIVPAPWFRVQSALHLVAHTLRLAVRKLARTVSRGVARVRPGAGRPLEKS